MEALATYIRTRCPEGLALADAVQLCMHIYRTGEGIPAGLRPLASSGPLAKAFASLAASGWVRRPDPDTDVSAVEFWAVVVTSATRDTAWRYDAEEGRQIAARLGGSG
ncbi:MAG TPA: hypothetical protein VMU00_07705 [Steroidobacteraceae bacterium]|nr:hypothetical protein [Steroidobacteraceae bacterium]